MLWSHKIWPCLAYLGLVAVKSYWWCTVLLLMSLTHASSSSSSSPHVLHLQVDWRPTQWLYLSSPQTNFPISVFFSFFFFRKTFKEKHHCFHKCWDVQSNKKSDRIYCSVLLCILLESFSRWIKRYWVIPQLNSLLVEWTRRTTNDLFRD